MNLTALQWYGGYAMGRYFTALEVLAAAVAVAIFISSLDDLFVDLWYWTRELLRRFTVKRRYRPLTVAQLHAREQAYTAVWRKIIQASGFQPQ